MSSHASCYRAGFVVASWLTMVAPIYGSDFQRDVLPILQSHCLDCHADVEEPEGGVNLERFTNERQVLRERSIWAAVYEKVESRQMPPPKDHDPLSLVQRQTILRWIESVAAAPDLQLGVADPGKPILRRLTRLEYNNTVRDLLGLSTDVFMFPERLPIRDKAYFAPETREMQSPLRVSVLEYGARMPSLLPNAGLPGDNRAEHGYRNRGDAMNFTPLMLEKYVALAAEIAGHPDLPRRSSVFATLLGIDPQTLPVARAKPNPADAVLPVTEASPDFAPDVEKLKKADGSSEWPTVFRNQIRDAFAEGRGGIVDLPESLGNHTVAGKGESLKVRFGSRSLNINPNADVWLAAFATAKATSSPLLMTNKTKGEKQFELTFSIRDELATNDDASQGIQQLGVCVLGRRGQSGAVTVSVTLTDGTESSLTAEIATGDAGTTFFSFATTPGESIRRLLIDGSRFSGDYVLIDDIGFITNLPADRSTTAAKKAPLTPPKDSPPESADTEPAATKSPVDEPLVRLRRFTDRAFRRPVTDAEFAPLRSLYETSLASGAPETDSLRLAVRAVLASPSFLYLVEADATRDAGVRPLNDYELASRLSYFLWASLPDDELWQCAQRGKLHETETLVAQTARMLDDPRSRELSESFATQWLRLDQLYTAKPDRQMFKSFYAGPQGKSTLHAELLVEALLLFETVLVEDRGILDFVDADYTWLNARLAAHYGLSADPENAADASAATNREVKTNDKSSANLWRRVSLDDRQRGGYLTMAGPMTVTSLPFRTSPVKRGAWLLETIFNRPPTEPRVAFAIEKDSDESDTPRTVRQKFELHRNQAACYSCHIRLDPPGFALENFDPIGRWRMQDSGQPVDASGQWNDRAFAGAADFKQILRDDPHEFTRGFIEHLLSYALARDLEIFDMPTVAAIERTAAEDDFRLRTIVREIVLSYPFRHVRCQ